MVPGMNPRATDHPEQLLIVNLMHSLVDFLNHGTLPFTGRSGEADRIVEFWRGASEAPGLQGALLLGEAGMGKSRLVEEVGARLARSGGAVVHTKLYPESATSIVPLVTRALWRFNAAHPLLKTEPEESLTSVLASLRRLIRLRSSMLIFEDVHLLSGGGIGDFGALLDALADEQVTVLCLARPVELAARGVLERYVTSEITMEGLTVEDMAGLWGALFGMAPDPAVSRILHRATAGNPLAIRSALRGALKSGAIVQDIGGGWRTTLPLPIFEETLARNVELLSEGMAAHLSEGERSAAGRIASLGEVFAHESAAALLGDDAALIEVLAFKGIIAETGGLIPPLSDRGSARPLLTFTHTLLHRRLVGQWAFEPRSLVDIIIAGLPIYSIVPFQLLGAVDAPIEGDAAAFIRQAGAVANRLDARPDWRLGMEVWEATWKIFTTSAETLSPDERFTAEAALLAQKIALLRRNDFSEEYRETTERLVRLTDRPLTEENAIHRLRALRSLFWMRSRYDYASTVPVREEIRRLVERFPELRLTQPWAEYIKRVAHAAMLVHDKATAREAEAEMEIIEGSAEIPEERRVEAFVTIAPHLLLLVESPEELKRRVAMLQRLEALDTAGDPSFLLTRLTYYMNIGYLTETARICRVAIPLLRELGNIRSAAYASLAQLYCRAATGLDLDTVETEAVALCEAARANAHHIGDHAALYFSLAGLFRGDAAWGWRIIERLGTGEGEQAFNPGMLLCVALELKETDEVLELMGVDSRELDTLGALRSWLLGKGDREAAVAKARELLAIPIIHTGDSVTHRLVIVLLERFGEKGEIAASLRGDIHDAVVRMIESHIERGLRLYAKGTIERFGAYLTGSERAALEGRVAAIPSPLPASEAPSAGTRIGVRMIGAIEIGLPGEEPNRPRGVRLRTLLGLMVADLMLEAPLSQREFCRLAAGEAQEFEDARKTVNLAVHRLREIVGHEAIITDRETPRLNLDLLDVDLLRAHRLLDEAESALREGSFNRAFAPLTGALDITHGEVILPTLYDEFFEAVREDFENRIRSVIIRAAKGLLRDGDAAGAEGVLRRAFAAMPEDEELAMILAETLTQLGKRTEARRVRLQAETLAG
jgi:hypothetical protein